MFSAAAHQSPFSIRHDVSLVEKLTAHLQNLDRSRGKISESICLPTARPKSANSNSRRISAFRKKMHLRADRDTNPHKERETLKKWTQKSTQSPFRAYSSARRRALCFDCLDTASCPRRTMKFKVAAPEVSFHRRNETQKRRSCISTFKRSVRLCLPVVKFKLSILKIRDGSKLLGTSLQIVI